MVAASDDTYIAKVLFVAWRETHNTFTQVSSETGIPGLIIYLCVIGSIFTALRRVWRESRGRKEFEQHYRLAYCLMLALLLFVIGGMFGSSAYHFFLPALAGISAAVDRCSRIERFRFEEARTQASHPGDARSPRQAYAGARSARSPGVSRVSLQSRERAT